MSGYFDTANCGYLPQISQRPDGADGGSPAPTVGFIITITSFVQSIFILLRLLFVSSF